MNIAFYTVLTEGYDNISDSVFKNVENIDHFLIVDKPLKQQLKGYKIIIIDNTYDNNFVYNRYYKFNPFDLFVNYSILVYHDSNVIFKIQDLNLFFEKINYSKSDIIVFRHQFRRTVGEEIVYAKSISKISYKLFYSLIKSYSNTKLASSLLTENNIIVYKNIAHVPRYFDSLLNFIKYYKRDQFFFYWVAKIYDYDISILDFELKKSICRKMPHLVEKKRSDIFILVHYLWLKVKLFSNNLIFQILMKLFK